MAALQLIILALACLSVNTLLPPQQAIRNTIFADEKQEGGPFEHDDYVDITPYNDGDPYRLPTTTRPIHYHVLWVIDIENLEFSGTVEIDLVATQAGVTEIVLHAHDLNILESSLVQGSTVLPHTISFQSQYHFLRIQLNTALGFNAQNPVIHRLTLRFSAEMRDDMYGIYKSWFRNTPSEPVRWMATTQFQATAARFAFPCYDEPSFKATFDISIRRPIGFGSWTCMRLMSSNSSGVTGYLDDHYYTTPVMSTYLLALIVAEYDYIREPQTGVLNYEVIARPSAIENNQGLYAFDVGQELLEAMSDHTGYDYFSMDPNLKMTQASIPDFSAGAMENWGLLTYREAYLMYDEAHTDSLFKQRIAYILSHEIAHMWFGNLVTCDWWDVLWLNEGFARYYQYFLTDWVEDYMGLKARFAVEQVQSALLTDAGNNPYPLTNPGISTPGQVSGMFSTLSYNKGAAVIRMTEHLLRHDVHRQGLRTYLTDRAFNTALPIHLFERLQAAAVATGAIEEYGPEFSVIDYYRSWTEQPGSPVLNVQVNHQTGEMSISQRRFNINTGFSPANTNWIIPINFASASNPEFSDTKPTHIIRDTFSVINRGTVGDEWVVFNRQQIGYYRVNYDDYTWNLIVIALRGEGRTVIHEHNRAQIVDDVFQFARSGLMTYNRAFNILSFLEYETEYGPWVAAMNGFTWIRNRLVGSEYGSQFEAMIVRWARTVMDEITYTPAPDETFMRSYLRRQLAPIMCSMGVQDCRDSAIAQFRNLMDNNVESTASGVLHDFVQKPNCTPKNVNGKSWNDFACLLKEIGSLSSESDTKDQCINERVPPDSRVWVYCNALRVGNEADFDFLWTRFLNHHVYTEKILLLQVLGCTSNQNSLNIFLNAIVQPNEIIRPQDYSTAYNNAVSGNEVNTQLVFQFVQNNIQLVSNAFGSITSPLSTISNRLRSSAEIDAFQEWATTNQAQLGDSYNAVHTNAQNTRQSLLWAVDVGDDMGNYFQNGDENLVTSTSELPSTVEPVTTARPTLVEPERPELPEADSAVTTYLSMLLLGVAIFVNVVLM